MKYSFVLFGAALLTAAATVTFATPEFALAQTATKLKCKGCVGKKQLGKKAVRTKAIKDGAVTMEKLSDGSVDAAKLVESAKPTGGDSEVLPISAFLNQSSTPLASFEITAPGPGYIIAMASTTLSYGGANTVSCAFLNTGVPSYVKSFGSSPDILTINHNTMFPAVLGNNTVTWACSKSSLSAVEAQGGEVVAFFVPNRY